MRSRGSRVGERIGGPEIIFESGPIEKQLVSRLESIDRKLDDVCRQVTAMTDKASVSWRLNGGSAVARTTVDTQTDEAQGLGLSDRSAPKTRRPLISPLAPTWESGGSNPSDFDEPELIRRRNTHKKTNQSLVSQEDRCKLSIEKIAAWSTPEFRPMASLHSFFARSPTSAAMGMNKSISIVDGAIERDSSETELKQRVSQRIDDIIAMTDKNSEDPGSGEGCCQVFRRISKEKRMLLLDSFMGIIIVLNVAVMGISCDVMEDWNGWVVIDGLFALCFLGETLVKLITLGFKEFFCGPDKVWHILEVGFTATAILEVVLVLLKTSLGDANSFSIATLRIVRLLRIARILRMVRFQVFAELVVMINGTMGGMRTLMWSCILICLALYAVALVFREGLGNDPTMQVGSEAFSSVGTSFFTVFRCIIVGDCAEENGRPLFYHVAHNQGWGFALLYFMSTFFITFGLFNVIVAIFVENVVAAARTNEVLVKRQRRRDKVFFANKMTQLVELISSIKEHRDAQLDNKRLQRSTTARAELFEKAQNIEITPEMFEEIRLSSSFAEICSDLEVSDEDHFNLFETLDVDGSGTIDIGELVEGIAKLRGDARRSDVIGVSFMVQRLVMESSEAFEQVLEMLKELKQDVKAANRPK